MVMKLICALLPLASALTLPKGAQKLGGVAAAAAPLPALASSLTSKITYNYALDLPPEATVHAHKYGDVVVSAGNNALLSAGIGLVFSIGAPHSLALPSSPNQIG